MSVHTMYSYLDKRLFTARNIDVIRKISFKPRKHHKTQITNRTVFNNGATVYIITTSRRFISDFKKNMSQNVMHKALTAAIVMEFRNAISKDGDGIFSGSGSLYFGMGKIRFVLFYFTLSAVTQSYSLSPFVTISLLSGQYCFAFILASLVQDFYSPFSGSEAALQPLPSPQVL